MYASTSIGVDIISISRIEQALHRTGGRFLKRIFTSEELDYSIECDYLATRFAAKEAFFKALGTGITSGVKWHDFILLTGADGILEPKIVGKSSFLLAGRRVFASVSSTGKTAVAIIILAGGE